MTRARLRRGIELVKLANRIENLKLQEEDPENTDVPDDATLAADQSRQQQQQKQQQQDQQPSSSQPSQKRTLSKTIKGAIFREVVLAKVREMKQQQETEEVEKKITGLE